MIGVVVDPQSWELWEQAKAYLEPARARGDLPEVIRDHDELFVALDGDDLMGCATAWFNADENFVEVRLVGGRDHRRWVGEMDQAIGRAALEAGATSLRAWGRRGWVKTLGAVGWESIQLNDGGTAYVRRLGD